MTNDWDIRFEGRAWAAEEGFRRFAMTPEKFEMIDGRLFYGEDEPLNLLAMLLENVGAAAAVRLGDPGIWREAVSHLP